MNNNRSFAHLKHGRLYRLANRNASTSTHLSGCLLYDNMGHQIGGINVGSIVVFLEMAGADKFKFQAPWAKVVAGDQIGWISLSHARLARITLRSIRRLDKQKQV